MDDYTFMEPSGFWTRGSATTDLYIDIDTADEAEPAASAAIVGELRLLIPLAGLIDVDAECARLAKEISRVNGEIAKCKGKLDTPTFVANAPAAVVEQERQRLADFSVLIETLQEQARKLGCACA